MSSDPWIFGKDSKWNFQAFSLVLFQVEQQRKLTDVPYQPVDGALCSHAVKVAMPHTFQSISRSQPRTSHCHVRDDDSLLLMPEDLTTFKRCPLLLNQQALKANSHQLELFPPKFLPAQERFSHLLQWCCFENWMFISQAVSFPVSSFLSVYIWNKLNICRQLNY